MSKNDPGKFHPCKPHPKRPQKSSEPPHCTVPRGKQPDQRDAKLDPRRDGGLQNGEAPDTTLSDADLLQSLGHNVDAFIAFHRRWRRKLEKYIGPRINDVHLCEDAVQQTLLNLLQGGEGFDPTRAAGPYIYTAARNAMIDVIRRELRHSSQREAVPMELLSTHSQFNDRDSAVAHANSRRAIATLNSQRRSLQVLFYLKRFAKTPYRDLSIIFQENRNTLATRIHRLTCSLVDLLQLLKRENSEGLDGETLVADLLNQWNLLLRFNETRQFRCTAHLHGLDFHFPRVRFFLLHNLP